MNILTIDTATNIELVAVLKEELCFDATILSCVSHSKTLFESIDNSLKSLEINIRDLHLIAVGIGPGSFTGIRIAVTTARMIAQILNIPAIGIYTHLFYAASALKEASIGEKVLVAFDAKKNRIFGALYEKRESGIYPAEILSPGDYTVDFISGYSDSGISIVAGSGIESYRDLIIGYLPGAKLYESYIPSGKIACMLAEYLYINTSGPFHYDKIKPYYSRKPDAEIARDNRQQI